MTRNALDVRRVQAAARLVGWRAVLGLGGLVAPGRAARAAANLWFTVPERATVPLDPPPGGADFEVAAASGPVRGTVWGDGPAIYFIHGWGGHGAQVAPLVGPLVAYGYRVVTFDAPGHGRSAVGPVRTRRSNAVEFGRALGSVVEQHGPAHAVLAHSLGAVAAGVALASGWMSTERLVLVAPLTEVQTQLHTFSRLLRLGPRIRDRLADEVTAHTGLTVEELALERLLDRAAARPALLVHDRDDRCTPCKPTIELASRWPDTELVLTTGLGHSRLLADPGVRDHVVRALVGSGAMLSA